MILRMGKLQSVRGAGLFAIIPVLDNVVAVIDERIQTTAFNDSTAWELEDHDPEGAGMTENTLSPELLRRMDA